MHVITGDNLTTQPPGTLYQELFPSGLLGEVRILQGTHPGERSYLPLLPALELAVFDPSGLPTIHHPARQDVPWWEDGLAQRSFVLWDTVDIARLRQLLAAPSCPQALTPLELHLEQDPSTHTWYEATLLSD